MNRQSETFPLSRYLPPIPHGVATHWINVHHLRGKTIIDPFGASAALAAEAASEGVSTIVAANNPIARLLIEIAAAPPTPEEARQSLSVLATARIRTERIEPHIRALYTTDCPNCHVHIQARAFLWKREANFPFARLLECPHCATTGEFPATEQDHQNASQFSAGGLHHARALERVTPIHDPDRAHVEEALSVYPPRAVYALLTIINKLDTLNLPPRQEKILAAMLLQAFDHANTLWPYPVARERPRQLTIPPVYQENNIWQALENATNIAVENSVYRPSFPITYWPEMPIPEKGGICLFEGPIRDLAEQLSKTQIAGMLTALPRPNQAYWALSALWAGWLWGHNAVEHFKGVLRRRRFDWGWHTAAIQAALENLRPALSEGIPILGLVSEAEPGFISAAMMGGAKADFSLEGIELQTEEKIVQIHWRVLESSPPPLESIATLPKAIRQAARTYLLKRGEPCSYLHLHTAILDELTRQNLFPQTDTPFECYQQTQQAIQTALKFQHGFLRFGGSEKSLEVGRWWLSDTTGASMPLADRVEIAVAQYVIQNLGCALAEIENMVNEEFSGLLRPSQALIQECLESYGEKSEAGWQLREADAPSKRRAELAFMVSLITKLGEKLGFQVNSPASETDPCLWLVNDLPQYAFFISASAVLGKFLIEQPPPSTRTLIAIPGGRANLVMYKLQQNPHLQQIADSGWQFVKYRHMRQLAESAVLTADNLDTQLELDPLTYTETQLRMF